MLNEWVTTNYSQLVSYAKNFTSDPNDLVHFVYLRVVEAGFIYENPQKTDAYFKRAIKLSGISHFKKLYKIDGAEVVDGIAEVELDRRVALEKIDVVLSMLDEFDREVFKMHMEGADFKQVSRATGIPTHVFHRTNKKVRDIIKQL